MWKMYTKSYLLDISTGVCHDLNFEVPECRIKHIKPEDRFTADSLYTEIKRHPIYKKKCEFCMANDDMYD
jgi:hypothetical protein